MNGAAPLGLGAAAIGNLFQSRDDGEAIACVARAIEAGIEHVDTAPLYGFGLSERRVGAALAASGRSVSISTKVGRVLEPLGAGEVAPDHGFVNPCANRPIFDYSADGVARALEGSLERLGVDRIRIVLVHDLGSYVHGAGHSDQLQAALRGAFPRLARWKAEGIVERIGLGVNETAIVDEVLIHTDLDVVLLAGRHTLLDQTAQSQGFFERCAARGVGVMLGGVFNSGVLIDPFGKSARYNYAAASAALQARAQTMAATCATFGVSLPAAALAFARACAGVERVLIGPGSPLELASCLDWADTPIPDDLWQALRVFP